MNTNGPGAVDIFFAGGGEMGERIQAFDWSKSLGPIDSWPQGLKTAVRIMLGSRYAMWMGWGESLTFLYNDAYAKMTLGPKHPWALGRAATEVWSEIWGDIGPRADQVLRTGEATWDESLLLFLQRRGFPEESYHTFSYSPLPDDSGGVGGMLCVVTEDTERKIGERRLQTLRDLAGRATDETKNIIEACRSAVKILGVSDRDFSFASLYLNDEGGNTSRLVAKTSADLPLPDFVDLRVSESVWRFREILSSGRSMSLENLPGEFTAVKGGAWPESPRGAVVMPLSRAGRSAPTGFLVAGLSPRLVFNDAYRGFLELVTAQISTSLDKARAFEEEKNRADKLAELDRAKTVFFNNVSHEFRTPLTLMLGPLEDVIEANALGEADAVRLGMVHRNGLRLLKLANSLLDFSRIEAGRLRADFQATDLGTLTADLASGFRSTMEKAGLRLIVESPPLAEPVYVDRDMWEKIILNLLSNAFKFTFEGEVFVSVAPACDSVEIIVRDSGVGIPGDELPKLFDRFYRVESTRGRSYEGTGIGLALVAELVKLHGGKIFVESEPAKGTSFRIVLLRGTAHLPPDQIGVADHSKVASANRTAAFVEEAERWLPNTVARAADFSSIAGVSGETKVLIVDDNSDMRAYTARLFSDRWTVYLANDGWQALELAREHRPDLILTDVMMPRLDGFGLLRELRADAKLRDIPVIMLSARAGEEARIEGLNAGADDYVVKPFSGKELVARVNATLEISRIRRESSVAVRRSEERLNLALSASQIGFWDWNAATGHTVLSDTLMRDWEIDPNTFGNTLEECLERVHEEDRARVFDEIRTSAFQNKTYDIEYRVVRPSGGIIWVNAKGRVDVDELGRPESLIGVSINVTDRKAAERELIRSNAELARFAFVASHDLKEPLRVVSNYVQMLALRYRGKIDEKADTYINFTVRGIERMYELINDLLSYSRAGAIELEFSSIDTSEVVSQALDNLAMAIGESGAKIEISELPRVYADSSQYLQLFQNLIGNAIKYRGTRVPEIKIGAERSNGSWVFSVHDNGIGIAPEFYDKIFVLFQRLHNKDEYSGTGIGLSVCKKIVERHGGRIWVESRPGEGSTFYFSANVVERSAS